MKKKSLALLGIIVMLFFVVGVRAEEVEVEAEASVKLGQPGKALREQIQEERKALFEKNKQMREEGREGNKQEREDMREENKTERETFREATKAKLEGMTAEEKAAAMVTIKAERKALADQNRTEKQAQRKAQWDSKKTVSANIRINVDSFRETVRSRWESLWASFGKK